MYEMERVEVSFVFPIKSSGRGIQTKSALLRMYQHRAQALNGGHGEGRMDWTIESALL